jgi:hypothetical protein
MLLVVLSSLPAASFAADDEADEAASVTLGIDPSQAKAAGATSPDGAPPLTIRTSTQEWKFGFHGYLRAPFRTSFDRHENDEGEEEWRFEMPPKLPDSTYTDWKYTSSLGGPWAEMFFSFGNAIAVGTVSVATYNITDSGWRNLQSQLGIDQAFVTLNFPRAFGPRGGLAWNVGVFANRYGSAGRYDAGRYDTYIIGRTHIAGETLAANLDLTGHLTLVLEHGFGGKTDVLRSNPKADLDPDNDSNAYLWVPYAGQEGQLPAMVNHGHAGLVLHTHKLFKEIVLTGHFMHAFTTSEHEIASLRDMDGKMLIGGAELKANGAVFGDAYLGFSTMQTDGLAVMPDAIELLHSQGGWSMLKNFYGDQVLTGDRDGEPNPGKGIINTFAWQHMFSFSRLLWFLRGSDFWGQGPDLQLSCFGMLNFVDPDNALEPFLRTFARTKMKWGAEVMYTPIQYMGFGMRYDRVLPDLDYDADNPRYQDATFLSSYAPFSILAPKLVVRTAFVTHEEVHIQYARYLWSGNRDAVRAESPFEGAGSDRNAFMISVNMWW